MALSDCFAWCCFLHGQFNTGRQSQTYGTAVNFYEGNIRLCRLLLVPILRQYLNWYVQRIIKLNSNHSSLYLPWYGRVYLFHFLWVRKIINHFEKSVHTKIYAQLHYTRKGMHAIIQTRRFLLTYRIEYICVYGNKNILIWNSIVSKMDSELFIMFSIRKDIWIYL